MRPSVSVGDDVLAERTDLSVAPVRLLIMSPGDATVLIDSLTWTFAKTMPFVPHWYVVRDRDVSAEQFESLLRYLRANGRIGVWGSKPRSTSLEDGTIVEGLIYCDIGEFRYWTMGWPLKEETVINREEISQSSVSWIDVNYLDTRPEVRDV
jgi:hypothetical protein